MSSAAAATLLRESGPNELPSPERRSGLRIAVDVLREPLFALLLGAAVVYLLIGERREAWALLAFALLSVSISMIQQGRSEHMLQALRSLAAPRALVVRDGRQQPIPGRDVVVGDLLILSEGVRVPADAHLVAGDALLLDESLLTGESVAVQKRYTESRAVWSGTLVLRGTAWAEVTATGARSEIGRIGRTLGSIRATVPRLQQETRQWITWFAAGGLAISVAAVLLYGLMGGDWTQALLGGIALSMSMLPEEFPLVMTVFMVMGAWRLSRSQVLTRQATAIEALGSATVLCSDKTGTLTQNRMQLAQLSGADHELLLRTALAASDSPALDPMDQAIVDLAQQRGTGWPVGTPLQHFPLQAGRPVVARLWQTQAPSTRLLAVKGAPETLAALCRLDAAARAALLAQVDEMATAGMRVLGVAQARLPENSPPLVELEPVPLAMLGLLGFIDPLRDGVPAAVAECHTAGIRVVMITGDYPLTAGAIAHQAGIRSSGTLTGDELQSLDEAALARAVRQHNVYARITPAQKLRIVRALQANGEIVAMTGDGVNDAPALKAADIGISMSLRGTDVAREAASLILLDDNFSSIVRAVRLGRRIYDNLRKAMGYILAIHVPIAGLALTPILLGAPLVLTPLLIALLEMIIDPTCSIALEAEHGEADVMRRPPRPRDQRILTLQLLLRGVLHGTVGLILSVGVFLWARTRGLPPDVVRTISFVAVAAVVIGLLLVHRSFHSALRRPARRRFNLPLTVLLCVIVLVIGALVTVPATQSFLQLAPLTAAQWLLALGAGTVLVLLLETGKSLRLRPRGNA